ncbi:SDR family oxidoreductase [Streptomyces sp. TRM 70361]|uniref:SDR family oxidoreductase n=1 Tax=Streptomyces sp. TRM 70361 TaxID=3116553 RepID=UPI002E7AB967|nr:SDR family oxidoreductase [Streptomyces sp. TRM 70361]MEE1938077.1 SDR family oxidoreductase [Streptomyces sp. TRM 70361]
MHGNKRVAVVTGGSRGIGRAVAERLAADGQAVAIAYAGDDTAAREAVLAIEKEGGEAFAVRADIADEEAVRALFDTTEHQHGGVDVVVNAAGIMRLSPLAELDLDVLDRIHRTNVRGTFVVNREAARRVRPGGAIINFSTTVTRLSLPAYAAYAASKAAVEAIGPILAKELRGQDITVNAVAPGPTATELFLDGKSEEQIEQTAAQNPMGRLGTPEDIAEVVSSLAGPARWINGQTVYVNGGAA